MDLHIELLESVSLVL